jgi:hypothetical protein
MMKARIGKEITLTLHNEIGVLADLSRLIAQKGINIIAASAWVEHDNGVVHLVTDDNLRAVETLRAKSYQPREADVVLIELPHKPGILRHLTEKLATDSLDIHHLYATATADETKCLLVFACANNDRAVVLLNE